MGTSRRPMNTIGERLLKLKSALDQKQAERAELQGELNSLLRQLKEHDLESPEQAREWLVQEKEELAKIEAKMETELAELETAVKTGESLEREEK